MEAGHPASPSFYFLIIIDEYSILQISIYEILEEIEYRTVI
jgi:hypothetical protein